MKSFTSKNPRTALFMWALCALLAVLPARAPAEDIDLFNTDTSTESNFDNPNVLIILDNTSNWDRANQAWPDGGKQGESELRAIKTVIGQLTDKINVGLMMFVGPGTGREGGYIRFPVVKMTSDTTSPPRKGNKTVFAEVVDKILAKFNTDEKTGSNFQYSPVLFDAFKYFGGYTSPANVATGIAGTPQDATHFGPLVYNERMAGVLDRAAVPGALVSPDPGSTDPRYSLYLGGYTSAAATTYRSPISASNSCARNYIIFIGNGFPNSDVADLGPALSGIGGNTTQLPVPVFKKVGSDYLSTGSYAVPSPANLQRMADEWTRYMYQTDVNVVPGTMPGTDADNGAKPGQQNISTYTIDVYNADQSPDQTALLMSMARVGGGKYFAAKNENAIVDALLQVMTEIQAVNTVFASASLPVNATNRAQNENQVFIGMFRPASAPRWYGNLKRYQLADFNGVIDLADSTGDPTATPAILPQRAVNLQTGFIAECAVSYWTSDSVNYWELVPSSKETACTTTGTLKWSDSPDGPTVERGAVAEVIRKGNNPPTTTATPTYTFNRTVKTLSGSPLALATFSTGSSSLSADLVNFILGKDVNNELANAKPSATPALADWTLSTNTTRPSVHGDVVHSRPLPVNYATKDFPNEGVTVYYGANDGTLRAVDASTGRERWALIAPEFFSASTKFQRQKDSDTTAIRIKYPSWEALATERKDYFWDGSIGIYQNADNTDIKIFPTMRRGGRMIYAFSVTDKATLPASLPTYLWKLGCPNLDNDTGCKAPLDADDTKVTGIGQTWSMPSVAFIKGYVNANPLIPEPVIVMGGGYDACEDDNSASPPCSSPNGNAIYVIRASTGEVIKKFDTLRSVASDVAMVDVNNDGFVDYAYVADTGGNLYRIDFVDITNTTDPYSALPAVWTHYRVAYTNGAGRKFFYPPALLSVKNGYVYAALGSGDREHPLGGDYPFAGVTNRFYVYMDQLSFRPTTPSDADAAKRPVDLDDTASMNNNTASTDCSSTSVVATSSKKGWFMNLNQYGTKDTTIDPDGRTGEQTVTSALILSGMVTFSTNRPIPSAEGSCSTTLGEARGYWVNLLNGSGGIGVGAANAACGGDRSGTFVGGGLPPSPVTGTVDITVDGVTETRTVVIGAAQRDGSVSAPIGGQRVVPAIKPTRKRVYWFKNLD